MLPFQAAYKAHTLFQNVFPMPYAVDLSNYKVIDSHHHQTTIHKIIRTTILLLFFCFFIPTLILRIAWYCFHWKSFTVNHIDQLILYFYYFTLTFIFLPAFYTQHKHTKDFQYVSNQLFKVVKNLPGNRSPSFLVNFGIKVPFVETEATIMDILVYLISISCSIVGLGTVFLPFAISYDPVQFVFGNSSLLVKLMSAIVYFFPLSYGTATVISILILNFVFSEGILRYSSTIHFYKSAFSFSTRLTFLNCYKRFRTMQLLVIIGNNIQGEFLSALIFVGVFLGSVGTYMTFKMYSRLSLFLYMIGPATAMTSLGLALLLTFLNNFPYQNSKIFKLYWKQFVARKEDRRMLYACKAYGVDLGLYGMSTSKLGLLICDDIIQNSVTMLLMG